MNTDGLPLFDMEEQKKEAVLADLQQRYGSVLEALRAAMRSRYAMTGEPVHANHAREVLDRWGIDTGPWMGALFRSREWEATGGFVKSTAAGSHARILWTYVPRNRLA